MPTIDDVYTTDLLGNPKAAFQPGEAIPLTILATNHTAKDLPVSFEWTSRDPKGSRVGYLSHVPWLTLTAAT